MTVRLKQNKQVYILGDKNMAGLSPKLPIDTSNEGGYGLNKTYRAY